MVLDGYCNFTEVMKVLREKKSAKTKKHQIEKTTTAKKFSDKKVPVKTWDFAKRSIFTLFLNCDVKNCDLFRLNDR